MSDNPKIMEEYYKGKYGGDWVGRKRSFISKVKLYIFLGICYTVFYVFRFFRSIWWLIYRLRY